MSSNSSALQPLGGVSFQQQGSVDWVALGQQQFSMSVAILGRLSSAGVEPLTIAVGQAMCSSIPLGAHGEKMLSNAMAGLKACSSFGEVIWFGVGVKHILRLLLQTSQGASLVALCGALSEGHSIPTSALVLYQMAKRFGSPSELTPSFAQWQSLVKVCASIFCSTNFGIRVDQILRLAGYDTTLDNILREMVGHPEDLAEIIPVIGDVAAGRLLNVSIVGGPPCSWVAVFAEVVLGLRVIVKTSDDLILFANFDPAVTKAQVDININSQLPPSGIVCTGKVHALRSGRSFIQKFFRSEDDAYIDDNYFSFGGRIKRETMLSDTFGKTVIDLFQQDQIPGGMTENGKSVTESFTDFYIAGAIYYVYSTEECTRYANLHEFVHTAVVQIPELHKLKDSFFKAADSIHCASLDPSWISRNYLRTRRDLTAICTCAGRDCGSDHYSKKAPGRYCLASVSETILLICYLLGRLHMIEPLSLRQRGILQIYEDIRSKHVRSLESLRSEKSWRVRDHLIPDLLEPGEVLPFYMVLFSGDFRRLKLGRTAAAMSDGRVYCFIDSIRELSDRFEKASVVHVGAGSIQAGYRVHETVCDGGDRIEQQRSSAIKHPIELLQTDIASALSQDKTSPELDVTVTIEDGASLLFSYRLSSKRVTIDLSPSQFVGALRRATQYKCVNKRNPFHSVKRQKKLIRVSSVDQIAPTCLYTTKGEGFLLWPEDKEKRIIVRSHGGNMLGRCLALATGEKSVALLYQKKDLETFAHVYNCEREDYTRRTDDWELI